MRAVSVISMMSRVAGTPDFSRAASTRRAKSGLLRLRAETLTATASASFVSVSFCKSERAMASAQSVSLSIRSVCSAKGRKLSG